MIDDMQVYIANLGKYNEGELVGDWFSFPLDEEVIAERIGLNAEYEEYAIHDTDNFPMEISEYISIEELNRIYEQLGYAIPKVTTADRKKDPTRRQSGDSLLTRGKNPLDIDPRPSVRATIMALKHAAQEAEQAQEKVQDITAKEER